MSVGWKVTPPAKEDRCSVSQRPWSSINSGLSAQFRAITHSTPLSMFGQIVNITIAFFAFRASVPFDAILTWAILSYLPPLYLLYRWLRRYGQPISRSPSQRTKRKAIFYGIALAAPWGALGFWLLGQLPQREELILIALSVGMSASGSVLLAAIYPAAILYMSFILAPVAIKCFLLLDGHEYFLLGALTLSYMLFLVNCINSCWRAFTDKNRAIDELTVSLAKTDLAKKEIERAAYYDALTGLPNRRAFLNFPGIMDKTGSGQKNHCRALFYIDLDRFKPVNDAFGHDIGDRLLQAVASRLTGCLLPGDLLARLGGDEFTLMSEHVPDRDAADARAASILEKIGRPYNLEGHTVSVDASIGIALDSESTIDIEDLLKMADLALYKCKDESGKQFCHYDPSMLVRMEERRSLESGLRQAMKKDEFELYYQPLFDLKSLKMIGAEALIRWRHPLHGLVLPNQFLPLAEEMRLMDRIGAWVLERACRDAALWPDGLRVAVNLSPNQVVHTDIVTTVREVLSTANFPGDRLELEVTESVILGNNSHTQQKLVDLKSLGVGLTMDDFGTGYSSLAYLSRFPFDRIKIDRSFVDGMIDDNNCASIVRATVDLARSLKMLTTAEGIETALQLDKLAGLGVDLGQGYFFSEPLAAEDFAVFLLKTSIGESPSFAGERGFLRQTA